MRPIRTGLSFSRSCTHTRRHTHTLSLSRTRTHPHTCTHAHTYVYTRSRTNTGPRSRSDAEISGTTTTALVWLSIRLVLMVCLCCVCVLCVWGGDIFVRKCGSVIKHNSHTFANLTHHKTQTRVRFTTGLVPPHLNTTLPHAHALIRSWILRGGVQSTILFSNEQFIHARFLSAFFGFPDDFVVFLFCSDNSTVVYTQSQARLGTGDFDVNLDRVRDFINYLNDLRLNNGKCVGFMWVLGC